MIFLPIIAFFFAFTRQDQQVININGESANALLTSAYLTQNRIQEYTYSTTGDFEGHPFSYAATGTYTTGSSNAYWVGAFNTTESQKNVVTFTFDTIQTVYGIIYMPAYSTAGTVRTFRGLPTILNVRSTFHSDLQLKYQVHTNPGTQLWTGIFMNFTEPISCLKLSLEFVEVTEETFWSHMYSPATQEIFLLKKDLNFTHLTHQPGTGDYSDSGNHQYLSDHSVQPSECSKVEVPDGLNKDTLFTIADPHTAPTSPHSAINKSPITYEFHNRILIDSIVFRSGYSTAADKQSRRYDGYPLAFRIYTKYDTDEYQLRFFATGNPSTTIPLWDNTLIKFDFPIWCDGLKIEFEEVTADPTIYRPFFKYLLLMKNTDSESPGYDQDNSESETIYDVTIENTVFSGNSDKGATSTGLKQYGGSFGLWNCNTSLINNTFHDCTTTVAGGAIYVDTSRETQHTTNLKNLTFTNCESGYGGAVCIIATFADDVTSIVDCIFNSNKARNDGEGAAIYLVAQSGQVKACKFSSNSGSSIIKYASSEPSSTARILSSSNFAISDCSFDDIKEGSFYIDVDETFDLDGISLKDNKFKSKEIKQAIKINQSTVKHETKSKSSLFLTILVPTLCVISLLLIIFIIVAHKKKNRQSELEENHNEELTQDEV